MTHPQDNLVVVLHFHKKPTCLNGCVMLTFLTEKVGIFCVSNN